MNRRLVTLAAVASLLLCVATVGLWVGSYFHPGYVALFRGEKRSVFVGSGRGVLVLRQNVVVSPRQATLRHDVAVSSEAEPFALPVQAGPKGQLGYVIVGPHPFESCWFIRPRFDPVLKLTLSDASARPVSVLGRMDQIDVSPWLIVAATAVAPLWCYRRWRASRGRAPAACRVCGYDLRATPERCPECGGVAAAAGESAAEG